jgi:magnesium chelatase family protein
MNDQTQAVFLVGANPIPVRVQAEVLQNASKGPEMTIQGIANNRERRIRVLSALASVGLNNHVKVTVSLPDNKHEHLIGGVLDLAIAVSVLEATGKIKSQGFTFIGELGLDGSLRPVRGVLPMVMHCRTPVYVPTANAQEAAAAHGEVCHASSLKDVIKAFSTGMHTRTKHAELQPRPALVDLADIKGHEPAKRALEIAAAGGHHLLLIGPLGSGKSILAKAMQGILPELSRQEALESASVHSIAG